MISILKSLRPHQWSKNLLVLVPVLAAQRLSDSATWVSVALAFVVMSLSASAVYLINDLKDVASDRAHPVKRHRAIASGKVSVPVAWTLSAFLAALALGLASQVNSATLAFAALYLVANALYSFGLKKISILDVLLLAGLYSLRILMGGAATQIPISSWLVAFSTFFFLSLALAKRASELLATSREGRVKNSRRGYMNEDYPLLVAIGVASSLAATVVFALYLHSEPILQRYGRPDWLWLSCVSILYWSLRLWLLTTRGDLKEDPLSFALRDRWSYVFAFVIFLSFAIAA